LKRQVAIKVLPAALADDADRLARFQREAEVLAAQTRSCSDIKTSSPGSAPMTCSSDSTN
ncbi:MAG: hypothetical protein ABMA15_23205, partial [Vicinamibacterales bacterium]